MFAFGKLGATVNSTGAHAISIIHILNIYTEEGRSTDKEWTGGVFGDILSVMKKPAG